MNKNENQEQVSLPETSNKMVFKYGAMSSVFSIEADNKLTAYVGMIAHFGQSANLIALYEPKEIVENDRWINPLGQISERLDEIFGGPGSFDKYVNEHEGEIRAAVETIKQL